MIRESISVERVIELLNELNSLDPAFMANFIAGRIPCNAALGEHPTVQTGLHEGSYNAGPLGILNGLFGIKDDEPRKGWGPIAAMVNEDGSIDRFERTFPEIIG